MADEWTTCEACGLEYMGAHRCRAREGVDPVDVVEDIIAAHALERFEWLSLTADECAELAAAFGAIALRLREAGR